MLYVPILTVLLAASASAKQETVQMTAPELGMLITTRAYEAVCWYEYQKQFPKSNHTAFNQCTTQSEQTQKNALINHISFQQQIFIDGMTDATKALPSDYSSKCQSHLSSASSDGSDNEGEILADNGNTYPFRAFAYCLMKTLRQKFGDEAINSVKEERIPGAWHVTKVLLDRQNAHRALHGSPALKLTQQLMDDAQAWSEKSAAACVGHHFDHENPANFINGLHVGENLSSGTTTGQEGSQADKGYSATNGWYEEIYNYNWNGGPHNGTIGHFTQSVWKGSENVGYGYAYNQKCAGGNGKWFITARYYPGGNMQGDFEKNVFPPKH